MAVRRRLRRVALGVERALDGLLSFKNRRRPPLIEPYGGYATREALIARGRVLTHLRRQAPEPEQHWLVNLGQMLLLFLTDEVEGVRLRGRLDPDAGGGPGTHLGDATADDGPDVGHAPGAGAIAVSDAEGYFTLVLPRGERGARRDGSDRGDGSAPDGGLANGETGRGEGPGRSARARVGAPTAVPAGTWLEVEARIEGSQVRATLPVLVPGPDAAWGVISDIDDTLMETGAYSLARNLWTSLTGNALTRRVHPDAVALIERLSGAGRDPVFYVSSSPWNLHHFLEAVFARAGLVPGPMFLRDLGIARHAPADGPHDGRAPDRPDGCHGAAGPHGEHKGAAIDTLMEANPGLPFWLIGDTGQHDAEIYLDAARRHPGRVVRVALREPGPGPGAAAREAMEALRGLGVEVSSARDFWPVVAALPAAAAPARGAFERAGAAAAGRRARG